MYCHKEEKLYPKRKPIGCTCGKPIGIFIPPGQHIHPCPVHPDKVLRGSNIRC